MRSRKVMIIVRFTLPEPLAPCTMVAHEKYHPKIEFQIEIILRSYHAVILPDARCKTSYQYNSCASHSDEYLLQH